MLRIALVVLGDGFDQPRNDGRAAPTYEIANTSLCCLAKDGHGLLGFALGVEPDHLKLEVFTPSVK